MKHFFKNCKAAVCFLLAGSLSLWSGCSAEQTEPVTRTDTAMGTIIRQTVYLEGSSQREPDENDAPEGSGGQLIGAEIHQEPDITEEIMDCIRVLESEMLSWRMETAEVYQVNLQAGPQTVGLCTVSISEKLARILSACLEVSEMSAGALDITIGKLARLWNMDAQSAMEEAVIPTKEQAARALESCGYEKIILWESSPGDGEEDAVNLTLPVDMQLDLGAVGKGVALSEIAALLEKYPLVTGAVISVGGSVLTYGSKPDDSSFRVGIVNPTDTSANLGYLELQGQWCISTSGDYERYVEVDGVKYHHILDPKTGYPADSGVHSVTILTRDGLLSDALSTACFVLGVERGMELAEEFSAEALFVDTTGKIHMTKGMEQYFHSN